MHVQAAATAIALAKTRIIDAIFIWLETIVKMD